jgi:hypothetical protein
MKCTTPAVRKGQIYTIRITGISAEGHLRPHHAPLGAQVPRTLPRVAHVAGRRLGAPCGLGHGRLNHDTDGTSMAAPP